MQDVIAMRPALRITSPTATRELALFAAILVVGTGFSFASPYFLTPLNLIQTLRVALELAIVSAGMTLVIIMGGIDVSVGGILAVSAIIIGKGYQAGLPSVAVAPMGLLTGALLGGWNGFLTTKLKVPPIIATLGSMYIFSAIMFLAIGGAWISGLPGTLSPMINGNVLGIPAAAIVIICVYLGCWLILRKIPFGRHLYAIGCSEPSARLVGINVDRTKIATYAILGLLAGFAALLYVARLRNVEINIGTTVALEAIAATVLGGTSITGGVGSLLGTLLGVIFIRVIQNGLVLVGISSLWETVIIGSLLIIVLAGDALHNLRKTKSPR
ncbi:ABC transporter permease [Neorhizobium sp. P12A]|jgi:ribose transport system permease protein/AI-2 transport system permease protein|uniref:ABC transporter permease n=1 Tax=Rhizobium/Agrobacterium group TaxID=227290 RepID=UPI0010531D4A|nr:MULTISPECIES: ABC transporter permease [Rhizobium/Agrobacterium group]KAA0683855.1 ABC transporter permease [Neorhizobium sp. P12A]TCR79565.1 monosaccharide ABC transporter membrane protein (CUT2 family) [Rhizobium sp. BK376]